MKNLFIVILILFISETGFSQLTVKPIDQQKETFIYVSGNLFFVTGGINLEKNHGTPHPLASIYLRKEAQLIQGIAANNQNSGNGLLSVFQEGTSNAYEYNYWASPIRNAAEGVNFFGIQMLYEPETKIISSPAKITQDLNGTADPLSISAKWIYTYSGKNYSDWKFVGSGSEIPAGHGFTMKGVNGTDFTEINSRKNNPGGAQRYDFRGSPNNGNISVPVSPDQNILVGNPYPSALDLSLFLIENSGSGTLYSTCYGNISRNDAITGIAYFWDSQEGGNSHYLGDYVGGYGAFSPVDPCTDGIYVRPVFKDYGEDGEPTDQKGEHYDRRFSPIGQGFMVRGTSNSEVVFRNSHRILKKEGQNSEFKNPRNQKGESEKKINIIPKIRFHVEINGEYIRPLTLAFWQTATPEIDPAMDAKPFNVFPTDVGWLHNEEELFSIDVRPFNDAEEIPLFLRVKGNGAKIKFSVETTENFDLKEIFIHDLETEQFFPLKSGTFVLDLDPGIYHDRFKLSFRNNLKILEDPLPSVTEEVAIFQNNQVGELKIINPGTSTFQSISLYNLNGKEIYTQTNFTDPELFLYSTKNLANSVYIVRIVKKDGNIIFRKIRISN